MTIRPLMTITPTDDGWRADMVSDQGMPLALIVGGLDGSEAPLTVTVLCRACAATLTRREYHVKGGRKPDHKAIGSMAALDGERAKAHRCAEAN